MIPFIVFTISASFGMHLSSHIQRTEACRWVIRVDYHTGGALQEFHVDLQLFCGLYASTLHEIRCR